LRQEAFQTIQLIFTNFARGIPRPTVGCAGIDADKPQVTYFLGKRIDRIIDPFSNLPGAKKPLKGPVGDRLVREIVVVARYRDPEGPSRLAHP
jgi:hypothetical protein